MNHDLDAVYAAGLDRDAGERAEWLACEPGVDDRIGPTVDDAWDGTPLPVQVRITRGVESGWVLPPDQAREVARLARIAQKRGVWEHLAIGDIARWLGLVPRDDLMAKVIRDLCEREETT